MPPTPTTFPDQHNLNFHFICILQGPYSPHLASCIQHTFVILFLCFSQTAPFPFKLSMSRGQPTSQSSNLASHHIPCMPLDEGLRFVSKVGRCYPTHPLALLAPRMIDHHEDFLVRSFAPSMPLLDPISSSQTCGGSESLKDF